MVQPVRPGNKWAKVLAVPEQTVTKKTAEQMATYYTVPWFNNVDKTRRAPTPDHIVRVNNKMVRQDRVIARHVDASEPPTVMNSLPTVKANPIITSTKERYTKLRPDTDGNRAGNIDTTMTDKLLFTPQPRIGFNDPYQPFDFIRRAHDALSLRADRPHVVLTEERPTSQNVPIPAPTPFQDERLSLIQGQA